MERSPQEGKVKNLDELQQQLKHLEEDWDSLKQSNPGRVHVQHFWSTPKPCRSVRSATGSTLELLEDKSLRDFISSLEQIKHPHPPSEGDKGSGAWKVRNNDLVVEEIFRERRAAIESGKLKGRRLFDFDMDDLDGSTGDLDINIRWAEDRCSGHSSVLIQGSEVGSMCSYSSCSDSDEDDGAHGNLHLSSSSSVSPLKVESDKVVTSVSGKRQIWRGGDGNGERGMVLMMGYLTIVLIFFVLGIISLKSFEGFGDHQQSFDSLVPT